MPSPAHAEGALLAWMHDTASTGVLVRRYGEVTIDLRLPLARDGWYGLDGQPHDGDIGDDIGLPYRVLPGGLMAHDVASAQKSVVAVLVAIAADQGLLTFDDAVSDHLGTGWSRATVDQEAAVRLRHLMSMTSGLSDTLDYEVEPGTRWAYSLGPAWHLTKRVLVAATGRTLADLTAGWLTGPLGMDDTTWIDRPGMHHLDGAPFEALSTTTADLGRFGQLVLDEGAWKDQQIISTDRLDELLRPSQDQFANYALLWWRNAPDPLIAGAPTDGVFALGAGGQMCAVVPSRDAVVVRLGAGPAIGAGLAGVEHTDTLWSLALAD